jgi:photosystem II stability/assembly factor-like uncharacterized protein
MTGSYITTDGGESWKMFNLRGVVQEYAFDPKDANVCYALVRGSSAGMFRTRDRGGRWELVYPSPDSVKGMVARGDHAEERLVTVDSVPRSITALAIDPDHSGKLYAVQQVSGTYRFAVSDDAGGRWKVERYLDARPQGIYVDPSSPDGNRTIYITSDKGVLLRRAGKWSFSRPPAGVRRLTSFSGGYDSAGGRFVLYAISGKSYFNADGDRAGIFVTNNGGATWENRQADITRLAVPGAPAPEWRAIATSARNAAVVYVSYNDLHTGGDTTSLGVARSGDSGNTWQLVWQDKIARGGSVPARNLDGGWIDERYDPTWGENPFSIGVSPTDPDICYTTDFGRVIRTTDGGSHWQQVYTRKGAHGAWTSRGIDVTSSYGVVFDPFDHDHVFMANTDVGLMESHDRGQSWTGSTVDQYVPHSWTNTAYTVTFDPAVNGRAWVAFSGTHDLPRPKMWRTKPVASYTGGIAQTDDGGRTWRSVSGDIGEGAMTHVLMDASSDVAARTLYVAAFGKGVYKSVDGGKSWEPKSNGLPAGEPFAWRIYRRASDGHLFLIVARRSDDGSIGTPLDGALYRSVDGASTWTPVTLPEGTNGPVSLLTDAAAPGRLILSAWGRTSRGPLAPDTGGGIFVSDDDGTQWRAVLPQDQHVHDLTYDERSKTFYACGFTAAAWRSSDGITWTTIHGYDFKWGRRVDVDPDDPSRIFISTFGGGVWAGSAHGSAPMASVNKFSQQP